MITIIFSLVSLMIITPVILLFPLGFSFKWKLGLIGIAFILANVGLMAKMQLPLYQTIMIIFLLSSLISILLAKRITIDTPKQIKLEFSKKTYLPIEIEPVHIKENNEEHVKELIETIDKTAAAIEIFKDDQIDFTEHELILQDMAEVEEENLSATLEKNDPGENENIFDIDEDIAFLENRAKDFSLNDSTPIFIEGKENSFENVYMSEIEKLIESDVLDEVAQESSDSIYYIEMEELEEIEVTDILATREKDKKDTEKDEEIEIEELVFHK